MIDNNSEEKIEELAEALRSISPAFVQAYTVDRPASEAGLVKLCRKELERTAHQIGEVAGTRAEAYVLQCPQCGADALKYVCLASGDQFYQCRCGYRRRLL